MSFGQDSALSVVFENKKSYQQRRRIFILDEIRGIAVICMVFYHALYTFGIIFNYDWAVKIFSLLMPLEPIFAALFIFISGICTRLSHSNLKRGIILFAVAIGINIFTVVFIPSCAIRFGVLNLLSICMIEYGLFHKLFDRLNPIVGMILSFIIFVLTWGIKSGFVGIFNLRIVSLPSHLYTTEYLYPLGLRNESFESTDYFPIFPWFFVFSFGAYFAYFMRDKTLPEYFFKKHSAFLSVTGRYALYIYLLHQPLIFATVYIVNFLAF